MKKMFVFGHKNPDTDAICSAIAFAELKKAEGVDIEAVRLGDLNKETQYVLETFQIKPPRLIKKASDEGVLTVCLVDHNEPQQSVDDIDKLTVDSVIDHHRIANFKTNGPLYYRAEPVGCTATILTKLYIEKGIPIEKKTAGLMLSAIISDTLLFQSPTSTPEDEEIAQKLAEIANISPLEKYGKEMLGAGADVSTKTTKELLLDAKEFPMGTSKVEIAQINVVDENDLLSRRSEIESAINRIISEKALDLYLFVITNILTNDSTCLALGKRANAVEEAYQVKLENGVAVLKGVVSRKKQVVPLLTEVFNKQ